VEKKSIGRFLAALRKANGMTQKALAEKLNVSDKSVSRWEQDECAPDLSLIPVIAEIYGVTSDEILRGERMHRDSPVEEAISEKSEKQIERLIRSTATQFQVRSLISVGISLTGLLAAMICNFAFFRAQLGLLIGCVFYLAAIVAESVFLIHSFSKISSREFEAEAVNVAKRRLVRGFGFTVSATIGLFAFSLPLAIMGGAHWGIQFGEWLMTGFLLGLLAVLMCLAASGFVSSFLVKKGIYSLSEREMESRPMLIRLKRNVIVTVVAALVGASLVFYFSSYGSVFINVTQSFNSEDEFLRFTAENPEKTADWEMPNSWRGESYGYRYVMVDTFTLNIILISYYILSSFIIAVGFNVYYVKRKAILADSVSG
jgi:transcriptional regulator with XRE-family HTH domain